MDHIPQSTYDEAAGETLDRLKYPVDREAFRVVWMLHQAADEARELALREVLTDFELSWTHFEVLWNIWIFGRRDAGWVARAALISKSGLTTVLTQLSRRDLIVRESDAEDARRSLIELSPQGHTLMTAVFKRLNQAEARFARALNPDELEQLLTLLSKLLDAPRSPQDSG